MSALNIERLTNSQAEKVLLLTDSKLRLELIQSTSVQIDVVCRREYTAMYLLCSLRSIKVFWCVKCFSFRKLTEQKLSLKQQHCAVSQQRVKGFFWLSKLNRQQCATHTLSRSVGPVMSYTHTTHNSHYATYTLKLESFVQLQSGAKSGRVTINYHLSLFLSLVSVYFLFSFRDASFNW